MERHEAPRLLIVEDDEVVADTIATLAEKSGYQVFVAHSGDEAIAITSQAAPDALLTDLHLPGIDGNEVLKALRRRDPGLPAVVLTAYPEIETAVEAMSFGALDYVSKPADWPTIHEALEKALRRRAIVGDEGARRSRLRERIGIGFGDLLGTSPAAREAFALARRAASSRATVLLTGESGTGKSQLAFAIHDNSSRHAGQFVTLHCAALTETLIETELFGHEAGSFTGAIEQRIGRIERADGGTLFIDEVAEIPMATQTKLLGVLQDRRFERVGGTEPIAIDTRLIAATNADLARRVRKGRFREDLYYRLHVVTIELPPLRERGDDIMLLAESFLARHARANNKAITGFSADAREALLSFDWPGNVRELDNAVERAVVMAESRLITRDDLELEGTPADSIPIPGASLKEIEREAIRATFHATGGSTPRTAEILGMAPRTVQYRLKEMGLARPRGRPRKTPPPDDEGDPAPADGARRRRRIAPQTSATHPRRLSRRRRDR